MWFDPFHEIPMPKVNEVTKPKHPLDSDEERDKLTDMSIGIHGQPAAHEPNAVLRMNEAGYNLSQTQKTLGMFPSQIEAELKLSRQIRAFAGEAGRPTHGAEKNNAAATEYRRARDVVRGDELVQHGSQVETIRACGPDIVFTLKGGAEVKLRGLDEILIRPAK